MQHPRRTRDTRIDGEVIEAHRDQRGHFPGTRPVPEVTLEDVAGRILGDGQHIVPINIPVAVNVPFPEIKPLQEHEADAVHGDAPRIVRMVKVSSLPLGDMGMGGFKDFLLVRHKKRSRIERWQERSTGFCEAAGISRHRQGETGKKGVDDLPALTNYKL